MLIDDIQAAAAAAVSSIPVHNSFSILAGALVSESISSEGIDQDEDRRTQTATTSSLKVLDRCYQVSYLC